MNILIIPITKPENAELVISLAEQILSKYKDSSISTIVNLETYNSYYNCPFIDGLLVEPSGLIAKLRLIPQKHYDAVFIARNSLFWDLIARKAKVKVVKNITHQLYNKNFCYIVDLLNVLA